MSVQVALDNVYLRPSAKWGHTEYSLDYHKEYLARWTGCRQEDPELLRHGFDHFGFDFIWSINDGTVDWSAAGRTTDMGHASYASDGSDQRVPAGERFHTVEEVWAFDAVTEYGLPRLDEQVQAYQQQIQQSAQAFPNQLTTGGYYRTMVSGAIESFGWDMLLMAATDRPKMAKVFDSFFRRALFHMEAWARTTVEVLILHDDFVWTSGAFMDPAFYRHVIIPRYAQLVKPIHDVGKRVLFCSDGDYTEFAGDVAEAGVDGFIFEPCMDFGHMVDRFGQTHCLVGSFVDCRDLTFGTSEKVRADVDRTLDRLKDCKGAIVTVGNHLPANIPESMLDRYFEYVLPKLVRE